MLKNSTDGQSKELADLLMTVKMEGGDVNIKRNSSGLIQVLQVSTSKMKKAFAAANSQVLQIDTTFSTNNAGN